MDSRTRNAALARDDGVRRVRTLTRRIGYAAVAGALVTGAGFAHLLPTHLPRLNVNRDNGSGSNGSSSNDSGSNGLQAPSNGPGNASGPTQVTSGGS